MQYPAERYQPSSRPYRGSPDLDYPLHDKAATFTTCGPICFNNQKINLSQVFAGQTVGIKQTDDRNLAGQLYGLIPATSTMRPAGSNPLRIPSDRKCYLCLRNKT